MGIARGIRAFKDAKRKQEERSTRGFGNIFNFQLRDGEEALVRFRGLYRTPVNAKLIRGLDEETLEYYAELYQAFQLEIDGKQEAVLQALMRRIAQEEPFCFSTHWVNSARRSFTCVDESSYWPDFKGGCVGCFQNGRNQKGGASRPRSNYGFSLIDFRSWHKIAKGDKNEYKLCTADEGKCRWCRKASDDGPVYPGRVSGLRKWRTGKQWATTIMGVNDQLSRRCLSCGTGKIRVTGYCCGNPLCMEPMDHVDSDDFKVRCGECSKKLIPMEEVECTKCDDPARGSIADCNVLVSRAGAGKDDTTYNLQAEPFEELDEEWLKVQPVGWLESEKPISTSEQAALCGLNKDPFGGGGVGSEDYDDEDEDEDDDDVPY